MQPAPAPGPASGGHRPEIDGLRALAIAPVVVHHAAPTLLPGGFAGVDVFFVISGCLITGIIAGELASGRFTLRGFWERRARRIIPALVAMLAVTAGAAWAILTPEDFLQFAKALLAASLFASNLHFARDTGYFDAGEGALPLLHTWTLGVEEQFYLLFPLVMLGAWRWNRSALLPVAALLGAASLAAALWLAPRWPLATFYLLPTRMWELMLGAVCALLPRAPRADGRLAMAGLAAIIAGFALIDPDAPAPGVLFLLPTLGTALVLLFCGPATAAGRLLSAPPLVGLGLISFGLYLWHQPVLALAQYVHFGPLPVWALVAAVGVSVALASASWRWIEQPVRQRRWLAAPALLAGACAAALALPLGVGVAGYARALLPRSGAEAAALDGLRPRGALDPEVIPATGALGFVLYGDSHAGQYFPDATGRFGAGALISENGCLAAEGITNWSAPGAKQRVCAGLPDRLVELVRTRRIGTVIWAQRWDRELYDAKSGKALGRSSGQAAPALAAAITRTIDRLPPGTRVILVGNSPTAWAAGPIMQQGWLRCRAYLGEPCPDSYPATLAEGRAVNPLLRELAMRDPRVTYVDAAAPLCSEERCWLIQNGRLNYWDGSHMTRAAAGRVMGQIAPADLALPAPLP
ncbi:acyltransferase family protein [Erythrobacter oryzae]|uniref:acyltransferase family protein n=1 Tax=Erythrobacter oryzae TaxID=3019556 RepID=UPI002554D7A4|nr:acyltransferase family protein [Erythrobacter sp. COR-2]